MLVSVVAQMAVGKNRQLVQQDKQQAQNYTMNTQMKHSKHLKHQTQIALRKINEHQKAKQVLISSMITNPTTSETYTFTSFSGFAIKTFEPKERVRIQLLPNSICYYRMQVCPMLDPKIVVRHFQGGEAEVFVFYDRLAKDLDKAIHRLVLRGEIIVKLSTKHLQDARCIFLVFRSGPQLSLFVFRIDLKNKQKQSRGLRTDKSLQSLDLSFTANTQQKTPPKRNRSQLRTDHRATNPPYLPSQTSLPSLPSLKPQQKAQRIKQRKQQSKQKQLAATKRMENLEIHREKNIQAMKVVSTCKKMFNMYEMLLDVEEEKRKKLIQGVLPVLYLMKYCLVASIISDEKEKGMKRALAIKTYQKLFIRKIRKAYRDTKALQPDPAVRELQPMNLLSGFIGNCLKAVSIKKSVGVVYDTLSNCFPGLLINLTMRVSSDYRRVIRRVQRRWKARFQARMKMLLMYAEDQMDGIFKAYPHLKHVEKEYRDNQTQIKICIQYQKETAGKMKGLIEIYQSKLDEIEEYRKINKEIKEFNATVMKRKQKEQLEIPKKPAFPQFRFFRDILFVKALIRSQLEVLFRKFKKKNPAMFEPNNKPSRSPKKDKRQR